VAEFMLPLTDADRARLAPSLRDRIDPEYRVVKALTSAADLPLWDVDHAVTRLQLADRVLAGMRAVLPVADYRFWKPVLEARVTNDTLAVELAEILRPQQVADYQRMFQVTLSRGGRRLSVSLTPADSDRPISRVEKISEVSRSLETRFGAWWFVKSPLGPRRRRRGGCSLWGGADQGTGGVQGRSAGVASGVGDVWHTGRGCSGVSTWVACRCCWPISRAGGCASCAGWGGDRVSIRWWMGMASDVGGVDVA
jgi:hypothetical protein